MPASNPDKKMALGACEQESGLFWPVLQPIRFERSPPSNWSSFTQRSASSGLARWLRAVTRPWLPQIRTRPIRASVSSGYGFLGLHALIAAVVIYEAMTLN